MRHASADNSLVAVNLDGGQFRDARDVYKALGGWMVALLNVEQQIGPARDDLSASIVLRQQVQRFVNRARNVIMRPQFHADSYLILGLRRVALFARHGSERRR